MPLWFHVSGNTYGAWLPGDPRGFHTRHHKEHITSDAKRYEGRAPKAEELMRATGREPVRLSPRARKVALDAMVEALQFRKCEVRIACVDDHHFHILMGLPKERTHLKPTFRSGEEPTRSHAWVSSERDDFRPEVRRLVGYAKQRAARALSEQGLVAPCGVWATRMHMRRIVEESHFTEAAAYIAEHENDGREAAVWKA